MKNTRDEREEYYGILEVLCAEYLFISRISLDDGSYHVYGLERMQEMPRGEFVEFAKQAKDYRITLDYYINHFVVPEERDHVRRMTETGYIRERLRREKNFYVRYRVLENATGAENFEMHFVRTDADGESGDVIFCVRNVDSIIRNEEAYRLETQHDVEDTLEGAKTGLWTIESEEGSAPRMYADRTMRRLISVNDDISPEECYEKWFGGIDPEYVDTVQEAVGDVLRTGRCEVIYPWLHPVHGRLYVRCGGIRDDHFSGKGFRMRGYHQDITETMMTRQRQDKALMEALVEAQHANEVKTEFLSNMSHDIRTPINGILGMLTIADRNAQDIEKQTECRRKVRTAAEHLLSLINDVLDISKLESGAFTLERESFDAREMLDRCVEILRPEAEEHGIELLTAYEGLTHVHLIGSPLHLRQILINIIGNAVKYNKPGGKIYFTVKETAFSGKKVTYQFEVKDTGIGMSREFLAHIFEPFVQESSSARTEFRGTGLGMTITKNLVDQMDGTIAVDSEPDVGSTFVVTIPLELDPDGSVKKKEEPEPVDVSGMRVLLVEDNELNREIAQYLLEDAKVSVQNAGDGQEAVEAFAASETGEFDCILMDVMMPVMNGLDATRAIRAMEREDAATVPIIALSANAFVEDVQKAKDAGMNDHLAKPLDTDRMLRTMAKYRK